MNILQILLPQEKKFFPLFGKASDNLYQISKLLHNVFLELDVEKRRNLILEIAHLEHVGDEIKHETLNELKTTFITPFDREDIHDLVYTIDETVNRVNGSAKRILLYEIDKIPLSFIKFSEVIENSTLELDKAVRKLNDMKNSDIIKDSCVKVNNNESVADEIFENSIANLFRETKDTIEIIKIKDILTVLESTMDSCEKVSNVLETILIKNS